MCLKKTICTRRKICLSKTHEIPTQNKTGYEMTLNKVYFSPPKLGQKVTRAISVRVTGYFFKILSRVTFVVTGYFLAKLSRD